MSPNQKFTELLISTSKQQWNTQEIFMYLSPKIAALEYIARRNHKNDKHNFKWRMYDKV